MRELTLKELQDFCLEMMQDIHNFCLKNNIKYSLYAGSMLGAVRHQGFIPWDDDLDIIMPRSDYERFCKEYKSEKFELLYSGNCTNYYLAFARVCDRKLTTYETLSPWTSEDTGCWIDVFPADGFPSDGEEQYSLYSKCIKLRSKCIQLRSFKGPLNGNIKHKIRMLISKVLSFNGVLILNYVKKLCDVSNAYDYDTSEYWASLTNVRNHKEWKHHPKYTFENVHLVKFEDREFYIADGYDIILTQRFHDYMKLPTIDKRVPKQNYIHFYWRK